jgi:hypothetical protein
VIRIQVIHGPGSIGKAAMAAEEPGEDDEPECAEPYGVADLPTRPVLPSDFRAWRDRMGWTQEQAAMELSLSPHHHRL